MPDGEPIYLKGTNLGNWLLQEFWMMGQSTEAVNDQCTLESILEQRFGFEERERLMRMFRDNWITERDWDLMQEFGLNFIRLPFIWNLIEDENNPGTLREDAWEYLDYAIEQAEAHGMYVLLDLHGAVGSQGWEHHSGCAEQNLYWSTEDYQTRTRWLWQQIATRYLENETVAGYGLLNEPWGTTPENLAIEIKELYDAVREVDPHHIIVLPGHSAGINAYGDPADQGMTNVAFEMHFYPGIFGWGDIGYEVHRDWLRCGESGTGGVCEWNTRLTNLNTPFLIGEFQPWTGLGELGGPIARATYDTYASYGWASTSWSYKVLSNAGGQGAGTWGMVTNERGLGLLAKADTWACAGWDAILQEACGTATESFTVPGTGEQTYYLVIKAGSTADGALDVSLDGISIIDVAAATEMVVNGGFGSANSWTEWNVAAGVQSRDYNHSDAGNLPTGSDGAVLRLSGATDINGGIYQALTLQGGATYSVAGVFQDNGSTNAWAEIYLVPEEPVAGVDITGNSLPQLDFNAASKEEIEALFTSFSALEYDVHEELMEALTAETAPDIFSLPTPPGNLLLEETEAGVSLSWSASPGQEVTGYNVYRSTTPGAAGFTLIASDVAATTYLDTLAGDDVTYYYAVTAVDAMDESYFSDSVATDLVRLAVPGRIEAEHFSAMQGIQVETSGDTGGGQNIGYNDAGDWFEYEVDIASAGTFSISYRVASLNGSTGFQLLLDGEVIDTQSIAATGGWQTYTTEASNITLPAGEHTLRFTALANEWNLNWFEITAPE